MRKPETVYRQALKDSEREVDSLIVDLVSADPRNHETVARLFEAQANYIRALGMLNASYEYDRMQAES